MYSSEDLERFFTFSTRAWLCLMEDLSSLLCQEQSFNIFQNIFKSPWLPINVNAKLIN